MPLSLEEVESIRSDAFAEDVDIPAEATEWWTTEDACKFFESGGAELPERPTDVSDPKSAAEELDATLSSLLDELSFTHLADVLAVQSFAALKALGRPDLLSKLKELGVSKLPERQKLATAIAKKEAPADGTSGAAPGVDALIKKIQQGTILAPRPQREDPEELPTPGAAAYAQRRVMPPLPPYKRLSQAELKASATGNHPGEWYKLPLPDSLEELASPSFGAAWLTRALHAAGTLPADDAVEELVHSEPLPLQGLDAQGGAAEKAILTVRYRKPDNGLHTTLFAKAPFNFATNPYGRTLLSVQFGDGDGLELSAYQYLEGVLPVAMPRYYFADISRHSSYYLLLTECVPYAPRGRTEDGYRLDWRRFGVGEVLPKSGKYQDDRIVDAHLFYYALLRAMARMAAADKRGRFDEALARFPGGGNMPRRSVIDTKARRAAHVKASNDRFGRAIMFAVDYAPTLFGPTLADRAYLERVQREFAEMAPYFPAVERYLNSRHELFALSHINLQIDNAWFWRTADGALDCGLLDWYNAGRAPAVAVWMGCLSGVEPEVMIAHEAGLMRAYAEEYHKYGGPLVDPEELRLMYRLSFVAGFTGGLQYIDAEILKDMPSQAEWNGVSSHWDPLVMGKWNVRCRTVAILQNFRVYQQLPMYETFMAWVQKNPELCAEPEK